MIIKKIATMCLFVIACSIQASTPKSPMPTRSTFMLPSLSTPLIAATSVFAAGCAGTWYLTSRKTPHFEGMAGIPYYRNEHKKSDDKRAQLIKDEQRLKKLRDGIYKMEDIVHDTPDRIRLSSFRDYFITVTNGLKAESNLKDEIARAYGDGNFPSADSYSQCLGAYHSAVNDKINALDQPIIDAVVAEEGKRKNLENANAIVSSQRNKYALLRLGITFGATLATYVGCHYFARKK